MKVILAKLLKQLFRINILRKKYFAIILRLNKYNIFKNLVIQTKYDNDIKIILSLDEWLQQQIYFLGTYELKETVLFKNYININTVFYDVGANIGYYTLLAAKRIGENGTIYAFEPDSNNRKKLHANIELNNFKNVVIVPNIVSNKNNKTIKLFVSDKKNRGMSSIEKPDNFSGITENVQTISLDEFSKTAKFPDLIKIDVEGAEYSVLKGMKEIMKKNNPDILIEVKDETLYNQNVSRKMLAELIRKMEYNFYEIGDDGQLYISEELNESSLCFLSKSSNLSVI